MPRLARAGQTTDGAADPMTGGSSVRPAGQPAGGPADGERASTEPSPELLARAASGDEQAWVELVDRYGRRVFALAKSRVRRADLAEEITQSVFVTVSTKLRDGGYNDQGRFEPWLFRIAINRVRDEIRRQRRQAEPTDPGHLPESASSDQDDAAGENDRELASMRAALEELGDRDREVIELRHHGEMSFKQMAALLDEPVGTLLARHHRALKKLRAAIERRVDDASTRTEPS